MTMTFHADALHIERTPVHVILGLATEGAVPKRHIVMMRTLDDDDAPGHVLTAEPYFEVSGPETSGYGCLTTVTFGPSHIEIICNTRRCPRLQEDTYRIEFGHAVTTRWEEIREALGAIVDAPRLVITE